MAPAKVVVVLRFSLRSNGAMEKSTMGTIQCSTSDRNRGIVGNADDLGSENNHGEAEAAYDVE